MVYTTGEKVAAFMAIPDFDANTIPTSTEVTNLIVLSDARVDNIELSLSAVEKELLSTYLAAGMVARAPGLFAPDDGVILASSYTEDYERYIKEIRAKDQFSVSTEYAYARLRKVNR